MESDVRVIVIVIVTVIVIGIVIVTVIGIVIVIVTGLRRWKAKGVRPLILGIVVMVSVIVRKY